MADKNEETKLVVAPAPAPAAKVEKAPALKAPEGFKLVNWNFGSKINAGKHGTIDLETLTPTRAGKLVDAGFKYLERK